MLYFCATMKYIIHLFFGLVFSLSTSQAQIADSSLRVSMSPELEELFALYRQNKSQNPSIKGYRVQIFNGRKKDCLQHRGTFLKQYPQMDAYLLYQSPEFRTQVGDFRTRLQAEAFLRVIIAQFPGSFVVQTDIKPPKLKE